MKVQRSVLYKLFENNWCPKCGKVTDMLSRPGMPGIPAKKCLECNGWVSVNLLEDQDDYIEIPDELNINMGDIDMNICVDVTKKQTKKEYVADVVNEMKKILNDEQQIKQQLTDAGYDYAVAVATKAEIEAGAACGQLAIIGDDE